jgi:hypothetical protein
MTISRSLSPAVQGVSKLTVSLLSGSTLGSQLGLYAFDSLFVGLLLPFGTLGDLISRQLLVRQLCPKLLDGGLSLSEGSLGCLLRCVQRSDCLPGGFELVRPAGFIPVYHCHRHLAISDKMPLRTRKAVMANGWLGLLGCRR